MYMGGMGANPMMNSMGLMGTQTNNDFFNACMEGMGYRLTTNDTNNFMGGKHTNTEESPYPPEAENDYRDDPTCRGANGKPCGTMP